LPPDNDKDWSSRSDEESSILNGRTLFIPHDSNEIDFSREYNRKEIDAFAGSENDVGHGLNTKPLFNVSKEDERLKEAYQNGEDSKVVDTDLKEISQEEGEAEDKFMINKEKIARDTLKEKIFPMVVLVIFGTAFCVMVFYYVKGNCGEDENDVDKLENQYCIPQHYHDKKGLHENFIILATERDSNTSSDSKLRLLEKKFDQDGQEFWYCYDGNKKIKLKRSRNCSHGTPTPEKARVAKVSQESF